jgi:hypothetical protein
VGVNPQGQTYIQITVQDTGSGLDRVLVTRADNASVSVPAFAAGALTEQQVVATKIDQSQGASVALLVYDVAGNSTTCDPVVAEEHLPPSGFVSDTFVSLPGRESLVTVMNQRPGISDLSLLVNDTSFDITGLADGEQRTTDVSSAMRNSSANTIVVTARGQPGGRALLLIGDIAPQTSALAPADSVSVAPTPVSPLIGAVPPQFPTTTSPSVVLDPSVTGALPDGAGLMVAYDPSAALPTSGEPSGTGVYPVGQPIRLRLQLQDPLTAADVAVSPELAAQSVRLQLPVLRQPSDGRFAWLAGVEDAGQFVGYALLLTDFDPATGTLRVGVPLSSLQDMLLVPVVLVPTFVEVTNRDLHIWSGPLLDAVDYGVPNPPLLILKVLGPQTAGRLFVFDPVSGSYGWVDANDVAFVETGVTP